MKYTQSKLSSVKQISSLSEHHQNIAIKKSHTPFHLLAEAWVSASFST